MSKVRVTLRCPNCNHWRAWYVDPACQLCQALDSERPTIPWVWLSVLIVSVLAGMTLALWCSLR